jgi:hypothetical protein
MKSPLIGPASAACTMHQAAQQLLFLEDHL